MINAWINRTLLGKRYINSIFLVNTKKEKRKYRYVCAKQQKQVGDSRWQSMNMFKEPQLSTILLLLGQNYSRPKILVFVP